MKKRFNIYTVFTLLFVTAFIYACANKGQGPQGGSKDETPPRITKSTPENGALNFQKKEIRVEFDENISLEKLLENVVVSPPQKKNPDIRAYGKRLIVTFEDDLEENTTYSINFGNAIVDLNEKNPLPNYRFSFSTGDKIDSLSISGILINAENLNPMPGIIVGIYSEDNDSVFLQKPFKRIGKTNELGQFSVDNISYGTYKLFALGDNNRDYYFQPGEGLALHDSLITPSFNLEEHLDTIYKETKDTIRVIDTVIVHKETHFLPDNILLRYFKEGKKRQYFVKSERTQPEKFTLYFNTASTEIPTIRPLNFEWDDKYILQKNNTQDTLSYWLKDSLVMNMDTLKFAMTYQKTDSIFEFYSTTDTLNLVLRKPKVRNTKDKDKEKEVIIPPLTFNTNIGATFEVYNPIILKVAEPLLDYDISKIKLYQKVDTILTPLKYTWEHTDSTNMNFSLSYTWEPEKSYELHVDSAAFTSIYNRVNKKNDSKFKIRSLDEYSEIRVVLTDYNSKAIIQVLNNKDMVLVEKPAEEKGTLFEYLKPADYYLRLYIDKNGNGKWDAGDLRTRRQPEEVYYYPYKLTLKANFEFTEEWDHTSIPLLEQKPKELIEESMKKK